MEKAKSAVSDFMSKAGKKDTTVHERVAPAVTHATQNVKHHEEVQTAVDREVHQDHYHTSVQPVQDREILPEQHHHKLVPVEHREHHHGNQREIEQRLQQEAAQFKDEHVRGQETHTHGAAPSIAGEHVHHHVHETIQPVVQKEVIEPHVTHTVVPVHEVHHNSAKHHNTSALPAVSMEDFKRQGGVLGGREEKYDAFEGEPRSIGKPLAGGHSEHHHLGHSGSTGSAGTTGLGSSETGVGSNTGASRTAGAGSGTTGHKPSLADKLNPRTDADGDGKRGIMD